MKVTYAVKVKLGHKVIQVRAFDDKPKAIEVCNEYGQGAYVLERKEQVVHEVK